VRDYRKYDVWIKSHELVLLVYQQVAPSFPKDEFWGLTSQLKRAAYSVPFSIVEGCGRNTDKDFAHYLDIALGSVQELEYCFLLAKDLGFIIPDNYQFYNEKVNEVKAKLINLIKSIRGNT
jgi:four helix bundle protein